MTRFPNDIVNIIYRFIWLSFIKRCTQQYHELFQSSFQGDYIVYKRSGFLLNDRLTTNYDEYKYIYNIYTKTRIRKKINGVKQYIKVSKNYTI